LVVSSTTPVTNLNIGGNATNVTGIVAPANGGTGIANNATMTVTGVGNYAFTRTLTGATNVTFPTSGTLYGTLSGSITSSQLATSLSDETGTGAAVFGTTPTLATPVINGTITGTTVIPVANGGTGASTLTANGILVGHTTSAVTATTAGNDGEVLTSNGTGIDPSFQAPLTIPTNIQVFSTSGTWTKPTNVTKVWVKVWGGGGGGVTASSNASGAGGGGGAYAEGLVAVTGNVTVTVGSGGAAGTTTTPTAGGASSFVGSTTVSANGGSPGSSQTGGTGGTVGSGTITIAGGNGGHSTLGDGASGGTGGGSPMGGAGGVGGPGANAAGTSKAGQPGVAPGGGGGGGNETTGAGGAGAPGRVIVYY
jgi:hypothetical protein